MRDSDGMTKKAGIGSASSQGDEDLQHEETGDVIDRVSGLWVNALFWTVIFSVSAAIFALLWGVEGWIVMIAYPVVGSTIFIGLAFILMGLRDGADSQESDSKVQASWSQTASPARHTEGARSRPFVTWTQREPKDITSHSEAKLAFCVGDERRGELSSTAETLVELNFSVNICNDFDEVLATIGELIRPCHTLVIDLDFVERSLGLDEIIGELQLFRQLAPQVRVLLVSSDFARHDFGTERLSIADVCLRSPVRESALRAGLIGAEDNNVVWLRRRSDTTSAIAGLC